MSMRPPLIPVQETHDPETTLNPVFELEYWREALNIADEWAKRSGRKGNSRWGMVSEAMALPASAEGVYLTHENGGRYLYKSRKGSSVHADGLWNTQGRPPGSGNGRTDASEGSRGLGF